MRIAGKTDIGRSRAENQDIFRSGYLPDTGGWGIVCDGMGGAQNGRLASRLAVETMEAFLEQELGNALTPGETEQLMIKSIELANAEVYARSGNGEHIMGTTVVCAVIKDDLLHIAHAGDSRAYIFDDGEDGVGRFRQLTRDHSMVQELVDQGILSMAEARRHPEKNVITRALGVEDTIRVSYSCRPIQPGTVVLLCSDGLTNMVPQDRIEQQLVQNDIYDLPAVLVNDALNAGGTDNITVLLMQI